MPIIVNPGVGFLNPIPYNTLLKHLEFCGRICYKSEEKIKDGSDLRLMNKLLNSKHLSVLEHISISVLFRIDRGVTHELVRHRISSYSQESTRYANYTKEKFGRQVTFIRTPFFKEGTTEYSLWLHALQQAEKTYIDLVTLGSKPQEARGVLPNSLKADIVKTSNIRQWLATLDIRCDPASHPQIRQVMLFLLRKFYLMYPTIFKQLYIKYNDDIIEFMNKPMFKVDFLGVKKMGDGNA